MIFMVKMVVFDLDGTLMNSLTDLAISVNYGLKLNGLEEKPVENYKTYVGNGREMLIRRAMGDAWTDHELFEKVKADYDRHYAVHCNDHTAAYDGCAEMLEKLAKKGVKTGVLSNKPDEFVDKIYHREEDINNVSHAITDYLVKSNQLSLPLADQKILGSMFYVVNDIERIGDHAENFADFTKTEIKHNTGLTGDAKEEIKKMYTAVSKLLKLSLECFMEQDGVNKPEEKLAEIAILEASIDKMERRYQKHHIKRLAKGECEPRAGLLFSDMLSELERIADHSVNIAYSMSDEDEDEILAAESEALTAKN